MGIGEINGAAQNNQYTGYSSSGKSETDFRSVLQNMKSEIMEKVKNGETEPSYQIGAQSFTQKEWSKLMEKLDKNNEAVREEQEERKEEQKTEFTKGENQTVQLTAEKKAPYSYLAKDGIISYNGVNFICDDEKQRICLGDVSNPRDCITVNLSDGGSLVVNRDNLGDLSKAIGMFSPEDVKRILCAIAKDNKAREMKAQLDEDENSIGEAEATLDRKADADDKQSELK